MQLRFECHREFPFPPEVVWPCLSKTDWLNRSLKLPAVKYQIEPRREGGSWIIARAKLPFGNLSWRELPFEWLEPQFYSVRRLFEGGPFSEARMGMELLREGEHTRVVSYAELVPRGLLGTTVARFFLGPKMKRDMTQLMSHTESYLRGENTVVFPRLPRHPVDETALTLGLERLGENSVPHELMDKLENFLRESPDVEMSHIRPLVVARQWQEDPWQVVSLFLQATRCGLFDLSWEVLCPNCRSTREAPIPSLSQLKRTSHCDVCQIEFDGEFDKSVELKFAVNRAVRPYEEQTFCIAGPGGKPHVVSQIWLEKGEERLCQWPVFPGPLRLQSPQVKEPLTLSAPVGGVTISCAGTGFKIQPGNEEKGKGRLSNPNPFPILVSWHQTDWSEDILTASRATNCQEFRDLFAREVISPTEQVTVGSQVILFTDLRGSTAMYHGMGDAPAYALVRNHFSILTAAIGAHHGAVIKTIGDAVMAAFSRVDEALNAVQESYHQLSATQSDAKQPLILKSSLHIGPCLAVNANEKLDFFGTTVNLAARMVECCEGGDLTVSDEFFQRPETMNFIQQSGYKPQPLEMRFRGFDTPLRVWRIKME